MAKSEIISNTFSHEMKRESSEREPTSNERDFERIVVAELSRRLPEGEGIKSCEGFKHLGVECCDTCHNFYPHDEMSVIDLPNGSKGWVCDPVKWAIYLRNMKNSKSGAATHRSANC